MRYGHPADLQDTGRLAVDAATELIAGRKVAADQPLEGILATKANVGEFLEYPRWRAQSTRPLVTPGRPRSSLQMLAR